MTESPESTTIVGGGIAGFTLASELRSHGYEGSITIIDPEGLPYDRPPLSKEILEGAKSDEELLFAPESWYSENEVSIVRDAVMRIDAEGRTLVLAGGTDHPFQNLVLATGGLPRPLPLPGFDDEGVRVLRTRDDALGLRGALQEGAHLAIIGAGLIGAEVASSARKLGAEVTLIDPAPVALVPALGPELAQRLHDLHAAHGVTFINGLTTAITRDGEKFRIDIDNHEGVIVDEVLTAVGIVPEEQLARSAELECDGGVLVDHRGATTTEGIWAIGDCARLRHPDGRIEPRHEHWESALMDAKNVAAAITGQEPPAPTASWFWTDRYGVHVEGVGSMSAEGSTIVREDAEGNPAAVFRLRPDGTMAGCAAVDDGITVRSARRIIDRSKVIEPDLLADPSVKLKKLAK